MTLVNVLYFLTCSVCTFLNAKKVLLLLLLLTIKRNGSNSIKTDGFWLSGETLDCRPRNCEFDPLTPTNITKWRYVMVLPTEKMFVLRILCEIVNKNPYENAF